MSETTTPNKVKIDNWEEHNKQFPEDYVPKRTLKHLGGDKFELTEEDERTLITYKKVHFKKDLMDTYGELKNNEIQLMETIKKQNKYLKEHDFEMTPEIERMKEIIEKVLNIQKVEKVKTNLEGAKKELETTRKQKRELEMAIPELLRKKK